MKINLIHIVLLSTLTFLSLFAKAQVGTVESEWNDVDFKDTTLISSEAFKALVLEQLYGFTAEGDLNRFDSLSIQSIGNLLGKAKVNMRVYEFLLEFMLNGYSNMGRDQVVDYLLNYPSLLEGEIQMEEGLRLDSISEPFQKVKIGSKAPDFVGVTIDGIDFGLYASKAAHTIVAFWSTDCEYCHDFLTQIRKNRNLIPDYELVTFALADNKEDVIRAVKKMRLNGYHFYDDLRWDSKAFLDFHVSSTPTVFVLDSEKTIVCKPYDWQEFKEWLKLNK